MIEWFALSMSLLIVAAIFFEVFHKVSRKTSVTRHYVFSTPWFGVKVHHIHGEDPFHTHPWWGLSLIAGTYEEDVGDGWSRRWFVNFVGPHRRHRVRGKVWTLFIHGPRVNENWEWDGEAKPWRGAD